LFAKCFQILRRKQPAPFRPVDPTGNENAGLFSLIPYFSLLFKEQSTYEQPI